ncbi:hypothetical protein [Aliivibrio fischeri]|uniref:hypothetical protein n=1 Tax=Aliivibrio fischeri TaxID=668 RepID=UPI00080EA9E0|nr:hypothetical protein [Aliivibrio fischeri]OCH02738.1 hypothetical protein A6E09_18445 [Aliivibrio fischeri]
MTKNIKKDPKPQSNNRSEQSGGKIHQRTNIGECFSPNTNKSDPQTITQSCATPPRPGQTPKNK